MTAADLSKKRRAVAEQMENREANPRKAKFRDEHKDQQDHIALAKAMAKVQRRKEKLEEDLKEANAEFDVLRQELIPTLMEDKGLENFRVAGLGTLYLTPDLFVSVKAGKQDKYHMFLRDNNLGDLIKESVNPSTLRGHIKEQIKKTDDKTIKLYEREKKFLNVTPYTRAAIKKA